MTLRTDDLKTACCLSFVVQLNIGTTAGHVGCDRNRSMLSGLCNDLCLLLMELCIQHVMFYAAFAEHLREQL